MEAKRRDFEQETDRTRGLIETRIDKTVRAVFRQIQEELPSSLAQLDRDIDEVVTGYLTAINAPFERTTKDGRIFLELSASPALPEELREGAQVAIGHAKDLEDTDPVHLGHPLVRAALEESRAATEGRLRVRFKLNDKSGDPLDEYRHKRGYLAVTKVKYGGVEAVEHLVPSLTLEDTDLAVVRIVRRCMRKSHRERYEDTRDLLRDLKTVALHNRELPPIPPVPQIPEPDVPSFGGAIHGRVGRDVRNALSGAEREIRASFGETEFYLRSRDGATKSLSERRLRRKLRRNRFSGDEMVRRGDEGEWVPIYESDLFRQEVPYSGDPAIWVGKRKIADFMQHACTFVTFGVAWYFFLGEVPVWMGFWGIGLAFHAMSTLPAALPFLRRKRELAAKTTPALAEVPAALPDSLLSASFLEEVERVKALLSRRDGEETEPLVAEVDAIVSGVRDLALRHRDFPSRPRPRSATLFRGHSRRRSAISWRRTTRMTGDSSSVSSKSFGKEARPSTKLWVCSVVSRFVRTLPSSRSSSFGWICHAGKRRARVCRSSRRDFRISATKSTRPSAWMKRSLESS